MARTETLPMTIDGVEYQTELAVIKDTMLGIEDHGILTCMLYLDYTGAGSQGAGGYAFDQWDSKTDTHTGSAGMAIMIRRILEVVGVDEWEKLKGKYVVALREPGFQGYVRGLHSTFGDEHVIFSDCFDKSNA